LPQIDRFVAQLAESCGCRQIEPLVGLDLVGNDALTEQVADTDIVERVGIISCAPRRNQTSAAA
jgi:hypothetical protein